MDDRKRKGYAWAMSAGFCAAMAAISAKLSILQFLRYGLVVVFNVVMWACYVNSLKALSSLQATVTNFATNFISSGLAGFFLFQEAGSYKTEQTIHTLEDMLRACALDFKGSWDKFLPLAKFAYNNSYHSSIQMALYEALYRRKCQSPLCWTKSSERRLLGPDIVDQTT